MAQWDQDEDSRDSHSVVLWPYLSAEPREAPFAATVGHSLRQISDTDSGVPFAHRETTR
jgi:hypothetical protein